MSAEAEQSRASQKLAGIMANPEVAFGGIGAAYVSLVDLGTDYLYNDLVVDNSTDQDIVLKFVNGQDGVASSEVVIPASTALTFDSFRYWDDVEIKYRSRQPTLGSVMLWCW